MNTFRFHYDVQLANQLREAVNEKQNLSIEKEHKHERGKYVYPAWDRICAIMDRLEDTIYYVNSLELGKCESDRSAFDFYEFINCSYVIIDCIKTMGCIFEIDTKLFESIEKSQEIFGDKYSANGFDGSFFEYIRSLCVVHPLCTNRQKAYLLQSKFHCCPFVAWEKDRVLSGFDDCDLIAYIYTSEKGKPTIRLPLYIKEFEEYLKKWINLIPKVIEAKEKYTDDVYGNFRNETVKNLSDFENDLVKYLYYLKEEFCKRFGDDQGYVFDEIIRVFEIKLTDKANEIKLEKYKNALRYSFGFLHNAMQNMSFEGYDNTGIKNPEPCIETDLFNELSYIHTWGSQFSKYSYNLSKLYYLDPNGPYQLYHKLYARKLLEEPKEIINTYVNFTNTEPDEEVLVLVQVASYLDALTNNNLLNKNIPNTENFRENILTPNEINELFNDDSNGNDLPQDFSL